MQPAAGFPPIARTRNIGILAHIDAGKTTTTERILFYTGVISRIGEVSEGTAFTDWMAEEQERGISITAASTTFTWRDHVVNLIDTPGHVDFTVEVERSLRVLDGAVVVLDAAEGVQSQTESVWRQADRYGVPRIAFVNKLDVILADPDALAGVLDEMRERLGARPVAVQLPYFDDEGEFAGVVDLIRGRLRLWDEASLGMTFVDAPIPAALADAAAAARDRMLEAIADTDEALLEAWLGGAAVDEAAIVEALRKATLARALVPVLCGAAFRNKGVHDLLDAIVDYLPSPADVPAVVGLHPETGAEVTRPATEDAPLAALAFKIMPIADPDGDARGGLQLTYFRVYSGRLRAGASVLNTTKGKLEQIGRLVRMHANHREEVSELAAGHIGAIVGVRTATTGDTLCDPAAPIVLTPIQFPAPVIGVAVEAENDAEQERLLDALARLAAEDPTFRVRTDPESLQTVISGMGELHLEVIVDRLRREHGLAVRVGTPQVAYRETVTQRAEAEKIHQRAVAAGAAMAGGQFGHVKLVVEPTARGAGYVYEEAVAGAIPRRYLPAVRAGVGEAVERGTLAGFPMTDLRVTVVGGGEHPVDSSDSGYKIAGFQAFQEAARKAGPTLLEPVMAVEVVTPESFVGEVIGDLHARRGRVANITGIAARHGVQTVASFVPLAAMFGYATDLRSRTQGRASFSMQFKHYAEVPHGLRDELTARARA